LKPTIRTSAVKKGIVASNAYTITLILSVPPPSQAANSYYHLMIIPHMGYYGTISFLTQLPDFMPLRKIPHFAANWGEKKSPRALFCTGTP
jgi:hypothetical protein